MKVWLLKVGEAIPSDEGEQRYLRMGLIALEFVKAGADVVWWVSSFDHNKKCFRDGTDKDYVVNEHYKLKYLHGLGYTKNWSIGRLVHYYQEKREFYRRAEKEEKPDVILAAMPNMDLANAAVHYGLKHNVPVFVDVRDTWPELYVDYAPKNLKLFVKCLIYPFKKQLSWTLKNAIGVFGTSDLFLKWALGYAGRPQNKYDDYFYVSYPNTDIILNDSDIEEWKNKGLSEDDFICCFFGQFGHAVDLEMVMRTSRIVEKKAPRVKFVICGTGEKLNNYKEIVGSGKNVIFPGWVNRKQIVALGKLSSAGLLSYVPNKNFENSMPNKFCEYLALGQVLLIQPKGMMADLAQKYMCGFHYSNENELAELLIKLSREPKEEIKKYQENARKLYEQQFKSSVVYKRLAKRVLEAADEWTNK